MWIIGTFGRRTYHIVKVHVLIAITSKISAHIRQHTNGLALLSPEQVDEFCVECRTEALVRAASRSIDAIFRMRNVVSLRDGINEKYNTIDLKGYY